MLFCHGSVAGFGFKIDKHLQVVPKLLKELLYIRRFPGHGAGIKTSPHRNVPGKTLALKLRSRHTARLKAGSTARAPGTHFGLGFRV